MYLNYKIDVCSFINLNNIFIYKAIYIPNNTNVIIKQYRYNVFNTQQLDDYYEKLIYLKSLHNKHVIFIKELIKTKELVSCILTNDLNTICFQTYLNNNFGYYEDDIKHLFKQIIITLKDITNKYIKKNLNLTIDNTKIYIEYKNGFTLNNCFVILTEQIMEPRNWLFYNDNCDILYITNISKDIELYKSIVWDIGIMLYRIFFVKEEIKFDDKGKLIWSNNVNTIITNNLKIFIDKILTTNKFAQSSLMCCIKDKWLYTNIVLSTTIKTQENDAETIIKLRKSHIRYIQNYF